MGSQGGGLRRATDGTRVEPAAAVHEVNADLPDAARVREWHTWSGSDFPRTPTGKPRRGELAAWLRQRAPGVERSTAIVEAREPWRRVATWVAEVGDLPLAGLEPDSSLGETLSSLERVELAAVVEESYGLTLTDEAFAGDRTLRELAAEIAVEQDASAGSAALENAKGSAPVQSPTAMLVAARRLSDASHPTYGLAPAVAGTRCTVDPAGGDHAPAACAVRVGPDDRNDARRISCAAVFDRRQPRQFARSRRAALRVAAEMALPRRAGRYVGAFR